MFSLIENQSVHGKISASNEESRNHEEKWKNRSDTSPGSDRCRLRIYRKHSENQGEDR